MCRSTGELAASTCAKRVKSRGEAGLLRMATAIRGMPGSEFEPRRPLQKKRPPIGWSFFLERRFCCAKSVACGRVIEREWGNPQRFPPHTPPSLRYARVRTTKPVGNHTRLQKPMAFGGCPLPQLTNTAVPWYNETPKQVWIFLEHWLHFSPRIRQGVRRFFIKRNDG